jgi:lipopolysaccharide export system permease protein
MGAPMILTTLDRHIARTLIVSTLFVFVIVLGLFSVVLFLDGVSDLGRAHFNLGALLLYVVLNLPERTYEIFPAATLVGTIAGLSVLALNSELTAMRAGGLSLARLVGSIMLGGSVFVLAGVLLGEFVVPYSSDLAAQGRSRALGQVMGRHQATVWFRDGTRFVRVGEVLPDLSLLNLDIYDVDSGNALRSQVHADRARYVHKHWLLQDVRSSSFGDGEVRTEQVAQQEWEAQLTPQILAVFAVRPQVMPAWTLARYIGHLKRNRQQTSRYELAFWNKLMLPFSTAVMILLAVPFVFGQFRGGGMGQRVFLGVMLGMLYSLIHIGLGNFGLTYGLPPVLGAILPGLAFLALAITMLRRVV